MLLLINMNRDCPLLQWMPFLTDPKPFFSDEEDAVMCYAPLTYGERSYPLRPYYILTMLIILYVSIRLTGIHKWELSPVERRMTDCSTDEGTEGGGVKSDVGGLVGYRKQDEIFRFIYPFLGSSLLSNVFFCADGFRDS